MNQQKNCSIIWIKMSTLKSLKMKIIFILRVFLLLIGLVKVADEVIEDRNGMEIVFTNFTVEPFNREHIEVVTEAMDVSGDWLFLL